MGPWRRRITSVTASAARTASSASSMAWPPRRARSRARMLSGRGMLPTWVVRMRAVLVFIATPPALGGLPGEDIRLARAQRPRRQTCADGDDADGDDAVTPPEAGPRAKGRRLKERPIARASDINRFSDTPLLVFPA